MSDKVRVCKKRSGQVTIGDISSGQVSLGQVKIGKDLSGHFLSISRNFQGVVQEWFKNVLFCKFVIACKLSQLPKQQ